MLISVEVCLDILLEMPIEYPMECNKITMTKMYMILLSYVFFYGSIAMNIVCLGGQALIRNSTTLLMTRWCQICWIII